MACQFGLLPFTVGFLIAPDCERACAGVCIRVPSFFRSLLGQRFQEGDDLPSLGIRQLAPGRHAILLTSVSEQPEQFPGRGSFHPTGVEVWSKVFRAYFSLGLLSMAGSAVLMENLAAGNGRIGIFPKRIDTVPLVIGNAQ